MAFESCTLFSDLKRDAATVVVVGRFDPAALGLSVRKLVKNETVEKTMDILYQNSV